MMNSRDSRLLVIAVVLGTIVAVPLACGGGGDRTPDNNGDTDQTSGDTHHYGGDTHTGGDQGESIEQICTDIKNKIDDCQADILCVYNTDSTVSDCVSEAQTTADDRDKFVASSCSAIGEKLCDYTTGTCAADVFCAVIQPTKAICAKSDKSAPAGAMTCTQPSDCSADQICGGSTDSKSCFATCAPPACGSGTHCTPIQTFGACLRLDGGPPNGATTCDSSADECAITQGCISFTDAPHKYCVDWCFLNDGTYQP